MFLPKQVILQEQALQYPLGEELQHFFAQYDIPVQIMKSARVPLCGTTPNEKYKYGKQVLVVGVRKIGEFQSCKPSAHYQLPLVSGCMGMCEYCYLQTQMSKRPYVKIYTNIEEIFAKADTYIRERAPEITIFEGAATSDPLPLEPYTHLLADTIMHFSASNYGRFRFVSKFNDVETLLDLDHNRHTEIRLSINIDEVIRRYEHRTPPVRYRLEALQQLATAGYPIGVLIAPVFWQEGCKEQYRKLLEDLSTALQGREVTFEIISHRFTASAKNNIMKIFPETQLPLNESERMYRYGQFGYGKYVYPKEVLEVTKSFFYEEIKRLFGESKVLYVI